jgi:2-polyprenyl-6-hydroxyphenyl methylase/3-demethylubiquinone-9 3-methyltransferase
MKNAKDIFGYRYSSASTSHAHAYLPPTVKAELQSQRARLDGRTARLFDLGSGNGSVASVLAANGWEVTGVDLSS